METETRTIVVLRMSQDTAAIIAPILESQAAGLAAAARRLSHRPGASGHMEEDSEDIYRLSQSLRSAIESAKASDNEAARLAMPEPVTAQVTVPTQGAGIEARQAVKANKGQAAASKKARVAVVGAKRKLKR